MNLYAYVQNNPLGGVDSDGHEQSLDSPNQGNGDQQWWNDNHPELAKAMAESESVFSGSISWAQVDKSDADKKAAQAQQASSTGDIKKVPTYNQSTLTAFVATPKARTTVVPNPESLVGDPLFGNGQCYALGVAFGMANSRNIVPGPPPDASTKIGKIIGVFAVGAQYNNISGMAHIAAFDGFYQRTNSNGTTSSGIRMVDQWSHRPRVGYSYHDYGAKGKLESDAANYRIVLSQ